MSDLNVKFNEDIGAALGKKTEYVSLYDKQLLIRENRQRNRTYLGITNEKPPFVGVDVWNHYEVSALKSNGVPVSFIGKIMYSATNDFIVESKSLKLYFGSFNNTVLGDSKYDVQRSIETTATKDLSELLGTNVYVKLFDTSTKPSDSYVSRFNCSRLEDSVDCKITDYKAGATSFIVPEYNTLDMDLHVYSDLLYSRCKITNQSDSGSIEIYLRGGKLPELNSLLREIVSMRGENHFHEEICEKVYVDLYNALSPTDLMVACYYNRRGSIDINPVRATSQELINRQFTNIYTPFGKLPRQ